MNPRQVRQNVKNDKTGSKNNGHRRLNRVNVMQLFVVFLGIIIIARLFYLQVIKHDYYIAMANQEHQKKFVIPAVRGSLYFRDGSEVVPAVLNATVYTLYADPKEVEDPEKVANIISSVLDVDRDLIIKLTKKNNTSYVVLAKRLNKDQVNELFKQKAKLIGVNVIPVPHRVYPEGSLAAQVLGFVNDEGIGQYGVEAALNKRLNGEPGVLKAVTDVHGVPLSLDDTSNIAKPAKNGEDMLLTIDRNIQAKAEEALQNGLKHSRATKGSVVVMDPNTGAVKAMVNWPSYDPAKYFDVGDDAYQKFQNRVVSDQYEAGSVIKVLTMASGIDSGAVNKDSTFNNTGYVQVDDAKIKNVEQSVNGTRAMTDVLKFSLNTGVVHILSDKFSGQREAVQIFHR